MKENKLEILKNATILLVEDDLILLKDLKATLALFFKEVLTASDGTKALEIYKNNHVDMLITDYIMPIMNGYELCNQIRETNKHLPIVIMSNYSEKDKLLKSIPLNLTEYLIKPIDYTMLTATLHKFLEKIKDENIVAQFITQTITYNSITKELFDNKTLIALSKSEMRTLEVLLKLKNSIVSNDTISDAINNQEHKSEQAIKNIIHRLRQKIGKDTIVNVQGFGYILRVTE